MIPTTLAKIASAVSGQLIGDDQEITTINHDTRKLAKGDLFIAIKGHQFDGHDYIEEAVAKGAIAVLVHDEVTTSVPVIKVTDTRAALLKVAAENRKRAALPTIALTGSCGKTTCKTMIKAILETRAKTHATKGSLNNDLGVPFTLLELDETYQYSVIEIGANHPREIDQLSAIVTPDIAMITNINPVHIEGFGGTLEAIATAKGEIFWHLKETGTAIFPYDSPYEKIWTDTLKETQKVVRFGEDEKADVYAKDLSANYEMEFAFTLCANGDSARVQLSVVGEHNVMNAVAAATACLQFGLSLHEIKEGLESMTAVKRRLNMHELEGGGLLIDDSYSANPAAVKCGIDVLMNTEHAEHILVLGEMGELGSESSKYHADVGDYAKQKGVNHLLTFGNMTEHAVSAFGNNAKNYTDKKKLLSNLINHIGPDTAILIKGSRFNRLEELVEAVISRENEEHSC